MKVLIDSPVPAALAHGGAQIQIEQTKAGLEAHGIEVEYLRWWDKAQRGDLIHYFGTASNSYLTIARNAGTPVIMTNLFTETCNRSQSRLTRQGWLIQAALKFPVFHQVKNQLNWNTYRNASHNVVGLECEKFVLEKVYRVPSERISLVPLGLSESFLKAGSGHRNANHLICTGTITERKCFVELAQMARAAEVPILFVGKPYHPDDPYWLRFKRLIDNRWVTHQHHTDSEGEMTELLQAARGFVLMSQFENWCLSAHEAVACGLPTLVQDQNWSRERFGNQARYFQTIGYSEENVRRLKQFHADAPNLAAPAIKLHSWVEISGELKKVYEQVLRRRAS
ncbi:MAG: glycosyltransferase [Verrucomicrobiota bacterium]